MRGEWIEITARLAGVYSLPSLPMRGEWIEIARPPPPSRSWRVSPHAGRVD